MNRLTTKYYYECAKRAAFSLLIMFCSVQLNALDNPKIDSDGKTGKPYLVKEFKVDGAGVLKAFTVAGNIDVQSIPETSTIRVELYVERGYAIWSNSRNLDNYRINILQRGNEIIASVEQKKRSTGFFSDNMSFSYKIYLPRAMSTELKTLGGHIRLSGVRGDQLAKTGGGNITLNDISGRIGAYTSGGTIDISDSRGTIFAQTEGGHIQVEDSEGEIRLKTAGGDITSEHISGSFLARTDGGNIRAQFLVVSEGISLETMAGNIYAEIPKEVGFNIMAVASRIDLDELENFYGQVSIRNAEGRINDGGTPLQLRTSSGTITVKTN